MEAGDEKYEPPYILWSAQGLIPGLVSKSPLKRAFVMRVDACPEPIEGLRPSVRVEFGMCLDATWTNPSCFSSRS